MSKNKSHKTTALKNKRLGYILLIPASVLIALVSLYPLINGIILGFQDYNLLRPKKRAFAGLDNFIEILTKDSEFYSTLAFSFIYTIFVVIVAYILGLCFAMLLNRDIKGRGIFRMLILIPWVIPSVVATTNWLWLLNDQLGFVNRTLQNLHIIKEPILFLADADLAKITVIFTGAWKSFPFMMIVLLAGLQGISADLYESASIDGAGFFKKFWYITLPSLKSVSMISTILMFLWTFNNFENIYLLTRGGPMNFTYTLPILSYYTAFIRSNIGYASAISTIMLVVLLVVAMLYMKVLSNRDKYE
ncbi:MAG: sugar ABC transporter permease [Clostridiales bacterium]|nr:sugar ABC transporter permease [Clostridiales bacterium]